MNQCSCRKHLHNIFALLDHVDSVTCFQADHRKFSVYILFRLDARNSIRRNGDWTTIGLSERKELRWILCNQTWRANIRRRHRQQPFSSTTAARAVNSFSRFSLPATSYPSLSAQRTQ